MDKRTNQITIYRDADGRFQYYCNGYQRDDLSEMDVMCLMIAQISASIQASIDEDEVATFIFSCTKIVETEG